MDKKLLNIVLIFAGLLTGFINGFFGGGGGMVCVPLLIYAAKAPVKKAHATAILIILPVSMVSGFFYFKFGSLDVPLLLKAGAGVILGGIAGALMLKKLSNNVIKIIFAAVMLAAGIKLILG